MIQPRHHPNTAAEAPEAEPRPRSEAASPRVNEKLARFLELLDREVSGHGETQIGTRG